MAITKVYLAPGPDGGDTLYVETGGAIRIPELSAIVVNGTALTVTAADIEKLASSGAVVASGTQAAAIADTTVSITDIGDAASGAEIATAVNGLIDVAESLASAAASVHAALRGFSILATAE